MSNLFISESFLKGVEIGRRLKVLGRQNETTENPPAEPVATSESDGSGSELMPLDYMKTEE